MKRFNFGVTELKREQKKKKNNKKQEKAREKKECIIVWLVGWLSFTAYQPLWVIQCQIRFTSMNYI